MPWLGRMSGNSKKKWGGGGGKRENKKIIWQDVWIKAQLSFPFSCHTLETPRILQDHWVGRGGGHRDKHPKLSQKVPEYLRTIPIFTFPAGRQLGVLAFARGATPNRILHDKSRENLQGMTTVSPHVPFELQKARVLPF